MNEAGRSLDSPPDPEIHPDTIDNAQCALLSDHDFLVDFVTSDDAVYKLFEREVLRKAAELHDIAQAWAADASIGNRDEE